MVPNIGSRNGSKYRIADFQSAWGKRTKVPIRILDRGLPVRLGQADSKSLSEYWIADFQSAWGKQTQSPYPNIGSRTSSPPGASGLKVHAPQFSSPRSAIFGQTLNSREVMWKITISILLIFLWSAHPSHPSRAVGRTRAASCRVPPPCPWRDRREAARATYDTAKCPPWSQP